MTSDNMRELALQMIVKILEEKQFSHIVLREDLKEIKEKQNRSFVTRLVMGTVESALTLDYIIHQYSTIKTRKMKPFIRNLLRMSVYQIYYMDNVPDSAVCNEAVKLAKKKKFVNLAGFVNGVLRNVSRGRESLAFPEKNSVYGMSVAYSCPEWLIQVLIEEYGAEKCHKILQGSQEQAGICVRVNTSKADFDKVMDSLHRQGIRTVQGSYYQNAVYLQNVDAIEKVTAFQQGQVQPQDESSMLVGAVAAPWKGSMVVDVCAAPGGKSLHVADLLCGSGFVDARDVSDKKVALILDNIKRCGFDNITAKVWDGTDMDLSIQEQADLVIADLPCSGLGVLGKKPDIKYQVTSQGLEDIAELQKKILGTAASYVKPGGVLVYSTCTILKRENIENVEWFLENFDFSLESIDDKLPEVLRNEDTGKGYLQLIQGIHNSDGFFIARFRRGQNRY